MFPRKFDPAEPELMDRPQPVSRELEVDLDNLVHINRNFGSYRLIRWFLRRWFQPGANYRILDLCTASGDIPRLMVDWARVQLRRVFQASPASRLEKFRSDAVRHRSASHLVAFVQVIVAFLARNKLDHGLQRLSL